MSHFFSKQSEVTSKKALEVHEITDTSNCLIKVCLATATCRGVDMMICGTLAMHCSLIRLQVVVPNRYIQQNLMVCALIHYI